jgi:hypothetical protein
MINVVRKDEEANMEGNNYYGNKELFVPPKIQCRALRQDVSLDQCRKLQCTSVWRCLKLEMNGSDAKKNLVESKVSLTL